MQNENKNLPESIWADGIPQNIKEEDKLDLDLLVAMATDFLMKNVVIPSGFKIEDGFPRKEIPNIVMKKDGEEFAIIVCPSVFPKYTVINDEIRLQFVAMCKERNTIALMAPVGYMSIDDERAKAHLALKGDVFKTTFPGFIVLKDEPHQDLGIKPENMYRPQNKDNNLNKDGK